MRAIFQFALYTQIDILTPVLIVFLCDRTGKRD